MKELQKSVLFIYLGYISKTHFFCAVCNLQEEDSIRIGSQIYNCMIHETMIKQDDQMIIFIGIEKEIIITLHLTHKSFKSMKYDLEELKEIYNKLLSLERKHTVLTFL
jgi:hypothetical protein